MKWFSKRLIRSSSSRKDASLGGPTTGQSGSTGGGREGAIQVFHGAQEVSVEAFNATSIGRDQVNVQVTNISNTYSSSSTQPPSHVSKDDILNWLDAPLFQQQHKAALSDRMDGTGVWFIESNEFIQFKNGKGETLWGTGIPGSGKTILSSISVDHLQKSFIGQPEIAVLYVYLRYNQHHSYRQILASLLAQLIGRYERALLHLVALYPGKEEKQPTPVDKNDMFQAFTAIIRGLSKAFVVLDGLDEAREEVINELLQELPSTGVNLLIMSRPLDLYTLLIPNATRIRIHAHPKDISVFIRERFKRNVRLQTIAQGKPNLVEELSTLIQEKSGGMFIAAHLQMNALGGCSSVYSLYEALKGLPSGIEDMYSLTLERIEAQSAGDASIAHRVITWLLHGREPLSVALIRHALSFSMEQFAINSTDLVPVGLILSSCQGLISLERTYDSDADSYIAAAPRDESSKWPSGTLISEDPFDLSLVEEQPSNYQFRFIHYTIQEYLRTSINLQSLPDPHVLISVTCVVFLAAYDREFQNFGNSFPYWYFRPQPLLGYSLRNWAHHARMCQDAGTLHPCIYTYFSEYPRLLHSDASDKDARSNSVSPDQVYTDINRLPGLHVAAIHELTEIINAKTLPLEADMHDDGHTPFHLAALYGKPTSLQALVVSYPDGVNSQSSVQGKTPLHIAIEELTLEEARIQALQVLAATPVVDPNIPTPDTGLTPLMVAARLPPSHAEVALRILCSRDDINVELKDSQGRTAFWNACRWDTGELLLSHYPSIDANVPDSKGVTPFMRACQYGSPGLFLQLQNRGNAMDIQDLRGRTALFYAFKNDSIANALLSSHPNLNVDLFDRDGTTPFMVACDSGNVEIASQILTSNSDNRPCYVDQVDTTGKTALLRYCAGTWASADGQYREDIVALLLRHGSDPRVRDRVAGRSALMWAADAGCLAAVKQLLAYDPSLSLTQYDVNGCNVLMLASPHFRLFDFLHSQMLFYDADLWCTQDFDGRTLLSACRIRDPLEILGLLPSYPSTDALPQRRVWPEVDLALHLAGQSGYALRRLVFALFKHPSRQTRHGVRKTVLGIATDSRARSPGRDFVFQRLLRDSKEAIDAFDWTLDNQDTVLLFAAVSSANRGCRSYPRLVLHYCYPTPLSKEMDERAASSPTPCDVGSCPQCDHERLCAPRAQIPVAPWTADALGYVSGAFKAMLPRLADVSSRAKPRLWRTQAWNSDTSSPIGLEVGQAYRSNARAS